MDRCSENIIPEIKNNQLRSFQKHQYKKFKQKAYDMGYKVPQTLAQYEAETMYYALLKLCDDPSLIHQLYTVKMKNGDINYIRSCKKLTTMLHQQVYRVP